MARQSEEIESATLRVCELKARVAELDRRCGEAERRPFVCLNAKCSLHARDNTCGAPDMASITTSGRCNMWAYELDDIEAARHAAEGEEAPDAWEAP